MLAASEPEGSPQLAWVRRAPAYARLPAHAPGGGGGAATQSASAATAPAQWARAPRSVMLRGPRRGIAQGREALRHVATCAKARPSENGRRVARVLAAVQAGTRASHISMHLHACRRTPAPPPLLHTALPTTLSRANHLPPSRPLPARPSNSPAVAKATRRSPPPRLQAPCPLRSPPSLLQRPHSPPQQSTPCIPTSQDSSAERTPSATPADKHPPLDTPPSNCVWRHHATIHAAAAKVLQCAFRLRRRISLSVRHFISKRRPLRRAQQGQLFAVA